MVAPDKTHQLLDPQGRPHFLCAVCKDALSTSDVAELGLRIPDPDETIGEYCDAELLDLQELYHSRCHEREAALSS